MSTTALVLPDRHLVTINGESYGIANVPDSSTLVAHARNRILGEIHLDDLLSKLELVGKLLFVAYNGVASQAALRGQVSTLQINYMRLCSKSQGTMLSFEDNCGSMLDKLKDLLTYLLSGKEQTALLYITEMAGIALLMAEQAKELETEFDTFTLEATKALAGAEVAKGTEEEKRQAYERARKNYEALSEGAKTLVDQISKQRVKLQTLYEEAKEAAEKHENRAFAMGLVGAIFGGIGQGLGAAAQIFMAAKIPVSLPAAPPPAPPQPPVGTQATADTTSKGLTAAIEAAGKAKEAVATAEKELGITKANLETIKTDAAKEKEAAPPAGTTPVAVATTPDKPAPKPEEPKKSEAAAKVPAAEAAVAQAEKNVATKKELEKPAVAAEAQARTRHELATAALKGLGSAMSSTGESVGKMGDSYAVIAASYNDEKKKYLQMLLEQQTEEGKALASIKEYAVRMENLTEDVAVADVVIKALHQALAALKQIVVILSTATELWTQMASHCNGMSRGSKSLKSRIELWMTTESPEDRVRLYVDPPSVFMKDAVTMYAGWRALQMVTKEYSAAAQLVKLEVQANVQKNVTTGDMLRLAIQEGKVLSLSADAGIQGNASEIQAIKAEQQRVA
jgi:tetratricopeptide (TPR) repeat protein